MVESGLWASSMIAHSKPWITTCDRRAVDAVLVSGMLAQGKLVQEFEARVAQYLGASGGVAVSSGTAALILALKALRVGGTDEVILPTYVCRSVLEAVISTGAKPVLCDIGDEWNMTVETVTPKITSRTAAIIVVHIFGIPSDTHCLQKLGVPIIEDCCQAFGTQLNGVNVGTINSIGILSFHATKCLTTGEGGMVVSHDANLIEKMRELRDGNEEVIGERMACPITDLQAALGLNQLARYSEFLKRRKEIASRYFTELSNCSIRLPKAIQKKSIFFRFPLRVEGNFSIYRQRFSTLNIQVRQGVDTLLHRVLGLYRHEFPVAEQLFAETISLPIYPALQDEQLEAVILASRAIWGNS
jgi:perosamine synthetase